jgi:hypothetical protein
MRDPAERQDAAFGWTADALAVRVTGRASIATRTAR